MSRSAFVAWPFSEKTRSEGSMNTVEEIKDKKNNQYQRKLIAKKLDPNEITDALNKQCCVKLRCHTKFSVEDIIEVRKSYHTINNGVDRREALLKMLEQGRRDSGGFACLGIEVCSTFIKTAYGVSSNLFKISRKELYNLRPARQANTTFAVESWLHEFSSYYEHMPNSNEIVIPFSEKQDLYPLFLSDNPEVLVSKSFFLAVWRERCSFIKIRTYLKFAKCDKCVDLREKKASTRDMGQLTQIQNELMAHLEMVKAERSGYKLRQEEAKKHPNQMISMIIDGTTQDNYCLPHFKESTKSSSTASKNNIHFVGVIIHGIGVQVYQVTDAWPKSSNLTIECIHRSLLHIESLGILLPDKLVLQLDNCWRENKNKLVIKYVYIKLYYY